MKKYCMNCMREVTKKKKEKVYTAFLKAEKRLFMMRSIKVLLSII